MILMRRPKHIPQLPISGFETIAQFIPHREPMVLVDTLLECSGTAVNAAFTIPKKHIFVQDNDHFSETGLLEHMAQVVALHTGYEGAVLGMESREGYIGAIKNAAIRMLPKAGDVLETVISITYSANDMSVVAAETRVGGKAIATATMSTFLRKEIG